MAKTRPHSTCRNDRLAGLGSAQSGQGPVGANFTQLSLQLPPAHLVSSRSEPSPAAAPPRAGSLPFRPSRSQGHRVLELEVPAATQPVTAQEDMGPRAGEDADPGEELRARGAVEGASTRDARRAQPPHAREPGETRAQVEVTQGLPGMGPAGKKHSEVVTAGSPVSSGFSAGCLAGHWVSEPALWWSCGTDSWATPFPEP